MSNSYLPEKCFAVCTFQLGTGYKQFDVSRSTISVTTAGNLAWLVETDKKLSADFTCKSGWSSGAGTMAISAGVLAGLAVAATVSVVPLVGWAVGGFIAIFCLTAGIIQMMQSPTCSQMIGYQESYWTLVHPGVYFDKQHALTSKSKLACKEGGVLLPFISETLAMEAAEAIGHNNQKEMGANIAAGFFTGFLVGYSFGGVTSVGGALKIGASFVGWILPTMFVFNPYIIDPMTNATSNFFAEMEGTSESYDEIKNTANGEYDPTKKPLDSNDFIEKLIEIGGMNKNIKTNKQQRTAFQQDIQRIQNAGGSKNREKRAQLRQEFEQNIRNGKYGQDVKNQMIKANEQTRGATKSNSRKGAETKNKTNSEIKGNRAGTIGALGMQFFVFPIISSYFGNEAVRLGAEIYDQDATNKMNVCTDEP